ncbi:MAG TPA: 3-dehydroquinate synthase [Desulfobacteraceae bacterium]|nr:3-dehydroquinate synthase [Desulfobacteraceae bacterium]
MKTFDVMGKSRILIGEKLENAAKYIPADKTVIITDHNVRRLYGNLFPNCEVIEIGMGESVKVLDTMSHIYQKLIGLGIDRSGFILGIGGGIVCDITGFAASTYLRGIQFGFVSTTLLAQVDASVGGKNGVNVGGYKNMVGTFNQPQFVICDMSMLKTLPPEELSCGFAEIVKHALIADAKMFDYLEINFKEALSLNESVIERLVLDSVRIKADIVNQDERESGERRKLNFGHTFGHAVEKTTGVPHGAAVSVGMMMASYLSIRKGFLSKQELKRIECLLLMLKLPTVISADREKIIDAMKKDKKRIGDMIKFVLLDGIGQSLVKEISVTELEEVSYDLCQ